MKILSRLFLVAAMFATSAIAVVAPAAPVLAGPELFAVCDPATPNTEAYRRVGGFCEAVADLKSLAPQGHGPLLGSCPKGQHDAEYEEPVVCVANDPI